MTITSLSFIVFISVSIIIYYVFPDRFRWIVLLLTSIAFYLFAGITSVIYIIFSALSIYGIALILQSITIKSKKYIKENKDILTKEQIKGYKKGIKTKKRLFLVSGILFNLLFLIVFKYSHFLINIVNPIVKGLGFEGINNSFSLLIPLGISYYTLQAIGYLANVYWGKRTAEKNFFKILLYISFFPSITQGPINDYEYITSEIYKPHRFTYSTFSNGFQRAVWGFFKKMVVADAISPYVTTILSHYRDYSGLTCAVGALLYMAQLYADFSGYMDIMCGCCEIMDIRLTENFIRPYFSKSIAELWRRWHISLGQWLKNYIYYPIAVSTFNQKLSQKTTKVFGSNAAGKLAATVPLVFVWSVVGIWHDASWEYILWGFGNAAFIISAVWLENVYNHMKAKLHINEKSFVFKIFQIIRTFVIFTVLETVAAVASMGGNGFSFIMKPLLNPSIPTSLEGLFPSTEGLGGQFGIMLAIALFGICLMFAFSIIQRKRSLRYVFNKIPYFVRIFILAVAVIIIATSGVQSSWGAGAFMYANF